MMLPFLLALSLPAAAAPKAPAITLVVADEATEGEVGWPLPCAKLAEALDRIEAGHPLAVALKFFVECTDVGGEAALARTLARHRNIYLQAAGAEGARPPDDKVLRQARLSAPEGADFDDQAGVKAPSEALGIAAAGVGFVHAKLDAKTGSADRWQVVSQAGGKMYASLALLVYARALGLKPSTFRFAAGKRGGWLLDTGAALLALDHEGAVRVDYHAPGSAYPRLPLARVLAGGAAPSAFADRLVVVGPDLPSRPDNGLKTPRAEAHPKVEIFADALATLLKLAKR